MAANPNDVLHFWRAAGASKWFKHDARFDEAIRVKFEPTHHAAARGEYDGWAETAEGALALLLLLDQLPRNLYRNSGHAFATDPKARSVARAAVASGFHKAVDAELRQFFVLPFEHSEDIADHDEAERLAAELADPYLQKWVDLHRDIIARFGRFPHRNPALGRTTTAAEREFLDEGGFSG